MMARAGASEALPDILVVKEDCSEESERRGGGPLASAAVSVYFEGGPRYRLGSRTYGFTAPMAMLVPKGTFDGDRQKGRISGIYALFEGHGILRLESLAGGEVRVSAGGTRRVVPVLKPITHAEARRIADPLRELASVVDSGLTGQLRRTSLLFQAVTAYCEAGRHTAGGVHREAARLRELIEQRAFDDLSLADLYAELDMSPSHAGVLFRGAFGVSPVRYRRRLRLQRARALLVSSKLNVGQVARAVGFPDPLYFSRVFRETFGVTPSSLVMKFQERRS